MTPHPNPPGVSCLTCKTRLPAQTQNNTLTQTSPPSKQKKTKNRPDSRAPHGWHLYALPNLTRVSLRWRAFICASMRLTDSSVLLTWGATHQAKWSGKQAEGLPWIRLMNGVHCSVECPPPPQPPISYTRNVSASMMLKGFLVKVNHLLSLLSKTDTREQERSRVLKIKMPPQRKA